LHKLWRKRPDARPTQAHPPALRVDSSSHIGSEDDGDLTATVIRGASLTGAGYLLTQVITFASYVALARLAGPHVFGTLAAAWTIVGVSAFVAESGMSSALIQRRDRLQEAAATATVATFAAGAALSLLALALSPLVGRYFHSHEVGLVAAAISGVLFLDAVTVVPDALLRRRFSFLRRGVVDPINALSYGAVAATLLALGMGVWALVIATYASGLLRVGTVWFFTRWRPDLHTISFSIWRELAGYGRHIVASEFLRQISSIVNTALVGRFLGLAALGEYRFGWRMATQAAMPVTAAGAYVLFPAFARISDDAERFRAAFLRSLRLFAVFVVPVGFALAPIGEQVVVAFLGERWQAAGQVLAALAGVTVMVPLITLATEVFKAANRPDLVARVTFSQTLGMIILMVALLPLGITAVAAGISAVYIVTGSYALRHVARVLALPARAILAELFRPLLAASAMAAALALFAEFLVPADGASTAVRLLWLAAEAALALVVYGAVLRAIAPATVAEFVHALHASIRRRHRPATATGAP
jgi:O-antigen/teichoic acid export membrane protein